MFLTYHLFCDGTQRFQYLEKKLQFYLWVYLGDISMLLSDVEKTLKSVQF